MKSLISNSATSVFVSNHDYIVIAFMLFEFENVISYIAAARVSLGVYFVCYSSVLILNLFMSFIFQFFSVIIICHNFDACFLNSCIKSRPNRYYHFFVDVFKCISGVVVSITNIPVQNTNFHHANYHRLQEEFQYFSCFFFVLFNLKCLTDENFHNLLSIK